jgi:hypothetical protein
MLIGPAYNALSILSAWDGFTWASPQILQASFVKAVTNELVVLGCVTVGISNEAVALVGCDKQGDIWALTSRGTLSEFLPVAQSAWSQPIILSTAAGDSGLPNIAVDQQNRFHAMWSQLPAPGNPGDTLAYIRGNGESWTDVATVLNLPKGAFQASSLLVDPNTILHLLWSGGDTGKVSYNQAFARDALVSADWGSSRDIPASRPVGDSPNIVLGKSGKLYAAYTIPFNEDRGLYFTMSDDLGESWSSPITVFDAAAAGWEVVHQAQLIVDSQEHLHLVWSRAASPTQESPLGVYYARSLDGGLTWTEPLEISTQTDDRPQIIISSDGTLHVLWAHAILNGHELVHRWSVDGGENWSVATRVANISVVAPDFGLAADSTGSIYLVGIERSRESSAALFYLRWNGQTWTDRDSIRLGVDFHDGDGARAALLPSGQFGVFYRMLLPLQSGSKFVVGYVGRQLSSSVDFTPAPTFTPRPIATSLPAATSVATLTPVPTPDWSQISTNTSPNNTLLIQIGVVVAVMVIVSALAIIRLWSRIVH